MDARADTPAPTETAPQPSGEREARRGHPIGVWHRIALAAGLGLALVAYWDLLFFRYAAVDAGRQLQSFLFTPADTSPGVVLFLAGWLLFRRRSRLAALPRSGGPPLASALLLGGGLLVAGWAHYTGAHDLLAASLILVGFGIGNLVWGPPGMRVLILPLGFVVFALPLPGPLINHVLFQFQLWTAEITGWLLYLVGIPAYVSGERIVCEGDTFSIVEACSGLRSVETLTMLSILMADLFRRRGAHAVLLVAAAPFVAFTANSFRALFLIVNPLSETVAVHNAQGIAILLGGLTVLYLLDGLLGRFLKASPPPAPPPGPVRGRAGPRQAGVALGVLGAAAALALWLPAWEAPPGLPKPLRTQIPSEIAGWKSEDRSPDLVFLGRVGFADKIERSYARNGDRVDLFIGRADHAERMRALTSPKTEYPGSGWMLEERESVPLPVGPEGDERAVDSLVFRSGTQRVLVYHWYDGLKGVARESGRSLLALDSSPYRRERDGFVVRLSTTLGDASPADRSRAERRLHRFASALQASLVPVGRRP